MSFFVLLDPSVYFEYFDESVRTNIHVCPPACCRSRPQCYNRRAEGFERKRNGRSTYKTLEGSH